MILTVDLFDVKPGKRQELIELVRETAPHIMRLGGSNVRLMSAFVPAQGIIYGIVEYDSMATLAAAQEFGNSDVQMQALLQEKWLSTDSPAAGVTRLLLREIKRFGTPPDDFKAAIVRQLFVKPGRLSDFMANPERVGSVLQTFGAGSVISVPVLGGESAGPNLIYSARFPDLQSLGKFLDESPDNKTIQQAATTLTASDTPATHLVNAIVTAIPL